MSLELTAQEIRTMYNIPNITVANKNDLPEISKIALVGFTFEKKANDEIVPSSRDTTLLKTGFNIASEKDIPLSNDAQYSVFNVEDTTDKTQDIIFSESNFDAVFLSNIYWPYDQEDVNFLDKVSGLTKMPNGSLPTFMSSGTNHISDWPNNMSRLGIKYIFTLSLANSLSVHQFEQYGDYKVVTSDNRGSLVEPQKRVGLAVSKNIAQKLSL